MDSQSGLYVDAFFIDCNWYYGCLFSPKKNKGIDDEIAGVVVDSDGRETGYCIAENERGFFYPAEKNVGEIKGVDSDGNRKDHCIAENGKGFSFICENERDFSFLAEKNAGEMRRLGENGREDGNGETEYIESMFRVLDEDGDGRVSADEMMRFLKRLNLGMSMEEVELTVRSVSACGDDFLTALEFGWFYRLICGYQEEIGNGDDEEKVIYGAFGVFDQNGDGFISAMELADILCKLGFVEGKDVNCCESMIESVDCNGDGFVDIHEFKHLIYRTVSPPYLCLQCTAAVN